MAEDALRNGNCDSREIAMILVEALRDVGNSYKSRGRPSKRKALESSRWRSELKTGIARGQYQLAIIARDLVDRRAVDPNDLAWFLFRHCMTPKGVPHDREIDEQLSCSARILASNMDEACVAAMPYAQAQLKKNKLTPDCAPRQGFRAIAAERIASHYRIPSYLVRRKLRA